MHIVLVHIQVKPEKVDEFIQASRDNVENSLREPGILRFDFLQQAEKTHRFTLIEVYRTPEDQLKHRETAHYLRWRDAVAEMMDGPREGIRYNNILPVDADWDR